MAYDELTAARVRSALAGTESIAETCRTLGPHLARVVAVRGGRETVVHTTEIDLASEAAKVSISAPTGVLR